MAQTTGELLRDLRKDKTLREVADDNSISQSALQMYETDQRKPRDEIKLRLASYYGTTVQALFFDRHVHG